MSYQRPDLVQGLVTTLGTNAPMLSDLAGTPSWSTVADSSDVDYVIVDLPPSGKFETLKGTKSTSGGKPTLTRVAGNVTNGSSGAGTLVNFTGPVQLIYSGQTGSREVVPNVTADPTILSTGQLWYRTDTNKLRLYDGAAVDVIDSATALLDKGGMVYNVKSPAYGAKGDGIANDNSAIQAALNAANAAGGGTVFVPQGTYNITGLLIYSNTTLLCDRGVTFFLLANSNKPMLANAHRSKTTRTDTQIRIVGGYWNANGGNQAATEGDATPVIGIAIYGGTDIAIESVWVHDSATWAFMFSNCGYCSFRACKHTVVTQRLTQDGIDLRGPCERIVIRNFSTQSYDDAIALNSRDYGSGIIGAYIGGGAITDVLIEGLILDNALLGVDLVSDTYLIDRIIIRDVVGTCQNYVLHLNYDPFNPPSSFGNIGSVLLDGVAVASVGTVLNSAGFNEMIRVAANTATLVVKNVSYSHLSDYRPYLRVLSGVSVDTLTVAGVAIHDTASVTSTMAALVEVDGDVNRLLVNQVNWWRGASLTRGGDIVSVFAGSGHGVKYLSIHDATANRIFALCGQGSGTLTSFLACGIRMDDCDPNGGALYVASATPDFTLSNFTGVAPVSAISGVPIVAAYGDAFLGRVLAADSFTRADSTSLPGASLEVGGTWTAANGTWVNSGGAATHTTGTVDYLVTDPASADMTLTCQLTPGAVNSGVVSGVVVRYTDMSNNWQVSLYNGNLQLYSLQGGSASGPYATHSFTDTPGTTYTLTVRCKGSRITASLANGPTISYNSATFNQTASKCGFRIVGDTGAKCGAFQVIT